MEQTATSWEPRGMVFKTDTYFPMDAITKKSGDQVFINLPKIMVDKMSWDKPPTIESLAGKKGSPASSVDNLYRSKGPSGMK